MSIGGDEAMELKQGHQACSHDAATGAGGGDPPSAPPLGEVLSKVQALLQRYVIVSQAACVAIVLWVAHAHVVEAFDATPYLAVTSPEKRSGKTRLLEVLQGLVPRPWPLVRPSEATLFRGIQAKRPTLLLDEVDAIFHDKSEHTEGLRALLNAGNRRGTVVSRCVGNSHELKDFKVFCPKVLAGIGGLPDTVADRSIPVELVRKRKHESVGRFRQRAFAREVTLVRDALEAWAATAIEALREAEPLVPDALHDRAADAWEPLLAVADLAGGEWPLHARAAALTLHQAQEDGDSIGIALLRAIKAVFEERKEDRLFTERLILALIEREGDPWGARWGLAFAKGDARGPGYQLAQILKRFRVAPKSIRIGSQTGRGYELADFADAFSRYLDDVTMQQPPPDEDFSASPGCDNPNGVTSSDWAEPAEKTGVSHGHIVVGGEATGTSRGASSSDTGSCQHCYEPTRNRGPEGWECPPDRGCSQDQDDGSVL